MVSPAIQGLLAAVEESPRDALLRGVLADAYAEAGDVEAEGVQRVAAAYLLYAETDTAALMDAVCDWYWSLTPGQPCIKGLVTSGRWLQGQPALGAAVADAVRRNPPRLVGVGARWGQYVTELTEREVHGLATQDWWQRLTGQRNLPSVTRVHLVFAGHTIRYDLARQRGEAWVLSAKKLSTRPRRNPLR